jgi:hypothetical protein
MAIDTTLLTGTAVESAEDALVALFNAQGIACEIGSTVRELVIRPMAVLQAHREQYDATVLESLSLQRVADGVVAGDAAIVDALASTFRVSRMTNVPSSGSLIVMLRRSETTYINNTYSFSIGRTVLTRSKLYIGVPNLTGYTSTDEIAYVQIMQSTAGYYMVMPVMDSLGHTFPAGTPVSFTGDTGNVSEVLVFSPITGGRSSETNKELASRILAGVPPGVLSTPLQLRGAFTEMFGIAPHRVAVYGSGTPTVRRGSDVLTGLPLPGYVDVLVAPSGGCGKASYTAAVTALGGDQYQCVLSSEQAAGAYGVYALAVNGEQVAVEDVMVAWGVDATTHYVTDGRYTSYQTLTLTFTLDAPPVEPATAEIILDQIRSIKAMQMYLDSSDRRAPGQDTLVRAPVPCFVTVSLAVSNTTLSSKELKLLISDHINNLRIGKGSLTAQDITDALPSGTRLNFPLHISGRFELPLGTKVLSTSSGNLTCPDWPAAQGGITAEETAFFTDPTNILVAVQ